MDRIEELENLCEGIINRAAAKSNALWQQGKALMGKSTDSPSSEKAGDDELPGSDTRKSGPSVHEVGVNATAKSLINSCKSKIVEARQKIRNLMAEGLRKRKITKNAQDLYHKKLTQIEDIIKEIDKVV